MTNISKLIIRYALKHRDANIADKLYHSLDKLLTLCPNLTRIDLGSNGMKDKHLKIISKTLSFKLPLLKALLLANNELTATKGCKLLIKIVNASKITSKMDTNQKLQCIMSANRDLSKDIASTILYFTNGHQDYDAGINEILIFRNELIEITDFDHRNIRKLSSLLKEPLL